MFPATLHLLPIKDLKDLSVLLCLRCYRHAGPNGPEEIFYVNDREGQATALRLSRQSLFHRRARACPLPCHRKGKGLGWRAFFARVECSRGTGPRATGQERDSPRHAPFGIRRSRTTVTGARGRLRGTGPRATELILLIVIILQILLISCSHF